jgi:hypothetical protein
MKNYILLLFVTALFQVNAQEFEVRTVVVEEGTNTQQGTYKYLKPMLVLEANGSSTELYQKAINWVNETYKNPEEVIKGKVEGDYLRLSGYVSTLLRMNVIGTMHYYDVRYTVKLNFRDGRFKYEITNMEQYFPPSQYSAGRWIDIMANNEVGYRTANKKGRAKKDNVANYEAIKSYFQNLGISIKEYMDKNDASKTSSKDDW